MTRSLANSAIRITVVALSLVATTGCEQLGLAPRQVDEGAVREVAGSAQLTHVVVQHVLISHEDADIPGVTRTIEQAEALAKVVRAKAEAGEDFSELVSLYGDDRNNAGVYAIANFGVPLSNPEEVDRVSLVRGFGDLAFELEPNEIATVFYDPVRSPHGYHVVKRLR